ncbi:MAG: 1-(5-phosphoribosyl)-5-((5-phosphoribosylamino)methylideneamino)imidazole-4-carboxamide isomerase [Coriobacteriaceae bacterium]|nr:1-(5-phosphoribosyl)-5-((5-phosphoribosylamino)methylideneamino)imidazole-4-carboxamide isomerase [Coriobacteriaceae bacterium]
MIVFPAIDILDGRVVRLHQGRLDAVKVYNDDPVDQARQWLDGGAEWLHVVDLDGAVLGEPRNIDVIERIVEAVEIPVQVGGGIRTMETIRRYLAAGVTRVVLGTTLVTHPELVAEACAEDCEQIVAGIDARDGKVAIEGWREGTDHGVLDLVRDLQLLGVRRLAYTDIALDGTQRGVNYGAYRTLAGQIDIPIIASGGVASLDDITDLVSIGPQVEGVIIGIALYEKRFSLPEAIAAARGGV